MSFKDLLRRNFSPKEDVSTAPMRTPDDMRSRMRQMAEGRRRALGERPAR